MGFLSKPFDGQVLIDCVDDGIGARNRLTPVEPRLTCRAKCRKPKYKSSQPIRQSHQPMYNGAAVPALYLYVSRQAMDATQASKVKSHADKRTVQDDIPV